MDNYYFHMDNLSVGYNRKALIHDICIGIKKGEIVTLIGPNGSGKSTILKSITRQDRKSTRLNSSHANESRMPSSA